MLLPSRVQVRARMQSLKEELFAKVNAVLELPPPASDGDAPGSSSPADSARRMGRDALAGRWRDVLDKCALRALISLQMLVGCAVARRIYQGYFFLQQHASEPLWARWERSEGRAVAGSFGIPPCARAISSDVRSSLGAAHQCYCCNCRFVGLPTSALASWREVSQHGVASRVAREPPTRPARRGCRSGHGTRMEVTRAGRALHRCSNSCPRRCRAARFWARAGGSAASREDLAQPLQDLHADIHASIQSEVGAQSLAPAPSPSMRGLRQACTDAGRFACDDCLQ